MGVYLAHPSRDCLDAMGVSRSGTPRPPPSKKKFHGQSFFERSECPGGEAKYFWPLPMGKTGSDSLLAEALGHDRHAVRLVHRKAKEEAAAGKGDGRGSRYYPPRLDASGYRLVWPGNFAGLHGWRRGFIGRARKRDVDGPSDPECGHVQRMLFPPRPRHAATSSVASRCARTAAPTPHSLSHCPMLVRATPHTPVPVPRIRAGLHSAIARIGDPAR